MDIISMGIDIGQIADLATQVATTGALRLSELVGDDIFEFTVGVVVVYHSACSG